MSELTGPLAYDIWIWVITPMFITFFVGLLFFVYRKNREEVYEQIERFPLNEE